MGSWWGLVCRNTSTRNHSMVPTMTKQCSQKPCITLKSKQHIHNLRSWTDGNTHALISSMERAVKQMVLCYKSPAIWCDNLPANLLIYEFWSSKLEVTSKNLLGLATHLHENLCRLLAVDHISRLFNVLVLADFTSFKYTTHLANFLSTFTKHFPPPQNNCWTLFQFNNGLKSLIFFILWQRPLTKA